MKKIIILKSNSKLNGLIKKKDELISMLKIEKDEIKRKDIRFKICEIDIKIEILKSKI
jgi:hypothetical protein